MLTKTILGNTNSIGITKARRMWWSFTTIDFCCGTNLSIWANSITIGHTSSMTGLLLCKSRPACQCKYQIKKQSHDCQESEECTWNNWDKKSFKLPTVIQNLVNFNFVENNFWYLFNKIPCYCFESNALLTSATVCFILIISNL